MKTWKVISILIPAVLTVFSAAPANPHFHRYGGYHNGYRGGYTRVVVRGSPYFYHYGHFYGRRHGGYFLVEPPLGITVGVLPATAVSLYFGPRHFYYYQGIYYRPEPEGYVVVPKPDTVYVEKKDAGQKEETFQEPKGTTVMVLNSNGSKTPVRLEELDEGKWKGPRDEIYDAMPTQDQLRSAYGF